jgi:hypothetical protein
LVPGSPQTGIGPFSQLTPTLKNSVERRAVADTNAVAMANDETAVELPNPVTRVPVWKASEDKTHIASNMYNEKDAVKLDLPTRKMGQK